MTNAELIEELRSPMFNQAGELGIAAHEAADRLEAIANKLKRMEEALRPFAGHVGKSDGQVVLSIGKDTWTDTLKTSDFERARAALKD